MTEAIKIDGLNQFRANLKTIERGLPKALRLAFNEAADVVVQDARPRIPSKSGRARASVKAKSTQAFSRVSGGGNKVPYYPWLDFGGRVGKGKSVRRPFLTDGRYIYNAFYSNRKRYVEVLERALITVAEQAGVEVE